MLKMSKWRLKPINGIMLCVGIFLLLFLLHRSRAVSMTIEIKVQQADQIQVFYDCGNGFNEQDSTKELIKTSNVFHTLVSKLPCGKISRIRIDPATDAGHVMISSIETNSFLWKHHLSANEIITDFTPNHLIKGYYVENNVVNIESIGNDPYVISVSNINKLVNPPKSVKVILDSIYLILIVLLGVVFCFIIINHGVGLIPAIAIIGYLWLVVVLQSNVLFDMLGKFNYKLPSAEWSMYKNGGPVYSLQMHEIYKELEYLCKDNPPQTVGIEWNEYSVIVNSIMPREFMLFEELYSANKNPVRCYQKQLNTMNKYIVVLTTSSANNKNRIVKRTEHFALFEKEVGK